MHNAVLAAHGVNGLYVPLRVEPADLEKAVEGLKALNITGVNVTVPHKEAIVPFLDGLSEEAKSLGAVNTLVPMNHALWGDNTDVGGFSDALAKADFLAQGKRAVILGAGGAARAVALAPAPPGRQGDRGRPHLGAGGAPYPGTGRRGGLPG